MRRDRRKELRLSASEERAWEDAARSRELTFSEYVRLTVNSSLREDSPTTGPVAHAAVRDGDTIHVDIPALGKGALPAATPSGDLAAGPETEVGVERNGEERAATPAPLQLDEVVLVASGGAESENPPADGSGGPEAPRAPLSRCSNAAFHVVGKYCRFCQQVPR